MALLGRRSQFAAPPGAFEQQFVPIVTIILGSLMALLPLIAIFPLQPPFGLLMLLAWRLPRPTLWPAWVGLPLGLFDDMFSGAPIGTAMCLWTLTLLFVDFADVRILWRDHRQDWIVATTAIIGVVLLGWAIAGVTGGETPLLLMVPQMIVTALLYPLAARACAALDRWRFTR